MRDINTADITKILDHIWRDKPETANRLRGRIEAILNWAKARGLRDGENPARWRGHLDHITHPPVSAAKEAKRARTGEAEHYAALPYDQIGSFMAALRAQKGPDARALEFVILTAARVRRSDRRQMVRDQREEIWTIPASRMKAGKLHRVPSNRSGPCHYQGRKPQWGICLRRRRALTFTDCVRTRCSKGCNTATSRRTDFGRTFRDSVRQSKPISARDRRSGVGACPQNKIEAAYQRGDLLEKRRKLMAIMGAVCEPVCVRARSSK